MACANTCHVVHACEYHAMVRQSMIKATSCMGHDGAWNESGGAWLTGLIIRLLIPVTEFYVF